MKSINKMIQELAKNYLVEWQVQKDYLRKIDRNNKKLAKYSHEAHWRKGADDYDDALKLISDISKNLNRLKSKLVMHEKNMDLIRSDIIKLNPYKKS